MEPKASKQASIGSPNSSSQTTVQDYYCSLESRLGYRLFLGNTRHFGYYTSPNESPFPVGRALRAMEMKLYEALDCPPGSKLLDAGCGVGHVAISMAKEGNYQVDGIDLVEHHLVKARRNVEKAGLSSQVSVRLGDYHHLEDIPAQSYDAIYTMETLVHSTDPLSVLKEFHRILKPGGRLALHEYDHLPKDKWTKAEIKIMESVNKHSAMPANETFEHDVLLDLVEQAGFQDTHLEDLSPHIVPMLKLFHICACVPFLIFRLFRIEHRFVNTMGGACAYLGRDRWRYTQVTGRKTNY